MQSLASTKMWLATAALKPMLRDPRGIEWTSSVVAPGGSESLRTRIDFSGTSSVGFSVDIDSTFTGCTSTLSSSAITDPEVAIVSEECRDLQIHVQSSGHYDAASAELPGFMKWTAHSISIERLRTEANRLLPTAYVAGCDPSIGVRYRSAPTLLESSSGLLQIGAEVHCWRGSAQVSCVDVQLP
jgi:hypothetical protein